MASKSLDYFSHFLRTSTGTLWAVHKVCMPDSFMLFERIKNLAMNFFFGVSLTDAKKTGKKEMEKKISKSNK